MFLSKHLRLFKILQYSIFVSILVLSFCLVLDLKLRLVPSSIFFKKLNSIVLLISNPFIVHHTIIVCYEVQCQYFPPTSLFLHVLFFLLFLLFLLFIDSFFINDNNSILSETFLPTRPVMELVTNSNFDVNYKFGRAQRTLLHSAAK